MSKPHQTIPGEPEEAPVRPLHTEIERPGARGLLKFRKKPQTSNLKRCRGTRYHHPPPNRVKRMTPKNGLPAKATCR